LLSAKKFFAESFFFAENIFFYSRQRCLRRELEIKLSPKTIALGEDSVSRSDRVRVDVVHALCTLKPLAIETFFAVFLKP
jgi:hypothetical protein